MVDVAPTYFPRDEEEANLVDSWAEEHLSSKGDYMNRERLCRIGASPLDIPML